MAATQAWTRLIAGEEILRCSMLRALLGALLITANLLPTQAQAQTPSLSDAFGQGSAMGRSGNATVRQQIGLPHAQTTVPGYGTPTSESRLFGGAGLSQAAADAVSQARQACAAGNGSTTADAQCQAIGFSQSNALQRPSFTLGDNDPLLARGRSITADPAAIAGQITGSYSGCSVETQTTPDRFETALCHQYRVTEQLQCDKVLIVTPQQRPGCSDGQFLTRVTADPCPSCVDYLAFDFSCAVNSYRMHAFTLSKATGQLYMDLGSQDVPGALDTLIPKTPGPTRIDGYFCYQTYYSQTCSGANCTIGAWFANPCQGTSYNGYNTFAMPTTVTFTDAWDNRCAALEARTQ